MVIWTLLEGVAGVPPPAGPAYGAGNKDKQSHGKKDGEEFHGSFPPAHRHSSGPVGVEHKRRLDEAVGGRG